MSIDISASAQKARARQFAASFDSAPGDAGVTKTRREPPLLRDHQVDALRGFALKYLPASQRDQLRCAVFNRLSGCPADGAFFVALVAAAIEIGVSNEILNAAGLTQKLRSGGIAPANVEIGGAALLALSR
jgi:hypothetical protein